MSHPPPELLFNVEELDDEEIELSQYNIKRLIVSSLLFSWLSDVTLYPIVCSPFFFAIKHLDFGKYSTQNTRTTRSATNMEELQQYLQWHRQGDFKGRIQGYASTSLLLTPLIRPLPWVFHLCILKPWSSVSLLHNLRNMQDDL